MLSISGTPTCVVAVVYCLFSTFDSAELFCAVLCWTLHSAVLFCAVLLLWLHDFVCWVVMRWPICQLCCVLACCCLCVLAPGCEFVPWFLRADSVVSKLHAPCQIRSWLRFAACFASLQVSHCFDFVLKRSLFAVFCNVLALTQPSLPLCQTCRLSEHSSCVNLIA